MSDAWIRLRGVNLERAGRPVLRNLETELTGRAIGLVGANGAGKSTLIGAMLGVLRPSAGSVEVLGLRIPHQATELRTRAGVMAEQAGVFPGGSGVDAVTFAGTLSGLSRRESLRRAHRVLDALDVGEERYRPTRGYSTGMRQRCKLAMSLVHDPEMLILDEPTVGLDPPGRLQLLRLIRDLRDEGRRVLISTHIMNDAEFLCDQILMIEAGELAYAGPIHRLMDGRGGAIRATGAHLDGPFAEALRAAGYQLLEAGADRISFEPGDDPDLRAFWRLAADHGVSVRSLGREIVTLEDAVVETMRGERRV